MIILFTDFGSAGPYVGQMKSVLHQQAPGCVLVDLFADAPRHNPRAAAYLLAAYFDEFPEESIFLCVVDPGVGDPARGAVVLRVDKRWLVGPDNGLFNVVAKRCRVVECWDITWRPPRLSASFHGRDVFAPVAARLARGEAPPGERRELREDVNCVWPDDLAEIIYIDHFGNAMTGLRASRVPAEARLIVGSQRLQTALTFSAVPPGSAFWYENANGLVEIAVNQGRADRMLGLEIGSVVEVRRE